MDMYDTLPAFSSTNNKFHFWFKPAGGVYRSFGRQINFPIQGIAIYDTWLLNTAYNNSFFDYYGSKGTGFLRLMSGFNRWCALRILIEIWEGKNVI